MSFAKLRIAKRITDLLESKGIVEPTEIQSKTYRLAVSGNDIIGVSKTGSGKTLAFVIPIISQIFEMDKPFHTLIITPTRELAQQISDCLKMFESLGVRWATLVGDASFSEQVTELNARPHVVVGTPGCIAKHMKKTKNFKIASVRKLVLDEADRFFEQDFTRELGIIAAGLQRKNQALMFTATITERTEKLCALFMRNPRIVSIAKKYEPVATLQDYYALVPEKHKLAVLCNYLKTMGNRATIVFVGMCRDAQKICALLAQHGIQSGCLHGGLPQPARESVIKEFRSFSFGVLVATDLASRGLDIPHVDLIVNFDLPGSAKDYMHRVGRTARAGQAGMAVSLVTQYDIVSFQKLEFVLGRKLPSMELSCYEDSMEITQQYDRISSEFNEKFQKKRLL